MALTTTEAAAVNVVANFTSGMAGPNGDVPHFDEFLIAVEQLVTSAHKKLGKGRRPNEVSELVSAIAARLQPGEPAAAEPEGDDLRPELVPLGAIPAYEGTTPPGLDTTFASKVGTIRHHRIGEQTTVLALVEGLASGHRNTARDGIRATQQLKVLEAYELGGRHAKWLGNTVRHEWGELTGVDVLPFKQAGDNALAAGTTGEGLTDENGTALTPLEAAERRGDAVVVLFAGGSRVQWPDDFPKDCSFPHPGDRLAVPGAGADAEDIVVELLTFLDGKTIARFDEDELDEDLEGDGGQGDGGQGDDENEDGF